MLRFTVLAVLVLCAALGTPVAAGPTIRRDDTSNAVPAEATTVTEAKPTPTAATPAKPSIAENIKPSESVAAAAASNDVQSDTSPGTTTQSSSSAAPSTTTTTTTEVPTSPSGVTTTKKPRKTITFDQRQEGEYNIRADLENFVIVVVPSGSSSGATLLDFLTRSAIQKKAAEAAIADSAAAQYHHHHHHHLQRKQQSSKRKNNKAHSAAGHKKVPQPTPEVIVLDEEHGQRAVPLQVEEFIEGRTPYKVDLSSASARSADHVARLAMPEPDTGAYPSFSDSVASGSEQQARAIVASVVRFPDGSGNYQRQQQQLEQQRAGASSVGSQQYGRALPLAGYGTNLVAASRAATNHNNLLLTPGDGDRDSEHHAADADDGDDRGLSSSSSSPSSGLLLLMPYGRGGGAGTGATGQLPPVVTNGSPSHESTSTPIISSDSLEYEPLRIDVDMTQLKLQPDTYDDASNEGDGDGDRDRDRDVTTDEARDGWDELRLLGATEQCGPDRRRDSYGVCQFVRS
uniref:Putative secreted protein n=2 Tax=Anopheles marajoara TaxID=58244 RepID=A0A2M4BKG8_9DIPT